MTASTRFRRALAGAMAVILSLALPVAAENPPRPPEYLIKAAYLYNFAMFVEWPRDAFSSPDAPLVIGILGRDPFGLAIDLAVENKRISKRRIVVERVLPQQDLTALPDPLHRGVGAGPHRRAVPAPADSAHPHRRRCARTGQARRCRGVRGQRQQGRLCDQPRRGAPRPSHHQFQDAWPRQDRPLIDRRAFMTFFTHASIKRKLMLITTVTSSLALLLASAGFVLYDLAAFRTRMSQDLVTQAEIISANSMAALAFRDERTVSEFLGALRAKEEIEAAAIYTPDGRLFAVYHRDPAAPHRAAVTPRGGRLPLRRERAARVPRHRPARAIPRHALHPVGHAAVVRAAAELHGYRRDSDARGGALRSAAVVSHAARDLRSRFSISSGP